VIGFNRIGTYMREEKMREDGREEMLRDDERRYEKMSEKRREAERRC